MTTQLTHDVLRRMASPPPPDPEEVPLTSSRAIRLAMTRAADKTFGMVVSVLGLREEMMPLDQMLGSLNEDHMLVALERGGVLVGLVALDLQLRAASIEAQTIGHVLPLDPEDRAPTGTDAEMVAPLLRGLLTQLAETTDRTELDGWMTGVTIGGRVASARAAGLALPEDRYRTVRLTLDLCVGDRQAELLLTLPGLQKLAPVLNAEPAQKGSWDTRFRKIIDASPVALDAVLHRFTLPLFQAEGLHVGQVVPLPGCTVGSVRLVAPDGQEVLTARLGQSAGMRAVRLEAPDGPVISEIAGLGGGDGAMPALEGGFGMDDGMGMMGGDDSPMTFDMDAEAAPAFDAPDMGDGFVAEPAMEEPAFDPDMPFEPAGMGDGMVDGMGDMAFDPAPATDDALPEMAPMGDLDWSEEDLPES